MGDSHEQENSVDETLATPEERFKSQLDFVHELDRLKNIERRTLLLDTSRRENSAEHSWHLAMMALVLAEHAATAVDLSRVIGMLLVHDIVEIDAGDTYAYDEDANRDKEEREQAAADRLFGLLPDEQAASLRGLWDEFEAGVTAEARFANALDRTQPMLLNHATGGRAWEEHGVTREQAITRNRPGGEGAPRLWRHIESLIDDATAKGWLKESAQEESQ